MGLRVKQSTSHDIFQDLWRWDFGGPRYESERWLPKSSEDTPFFTTYFPLAEGASVWSIATDRLTAIPEIWSL